MIFSPELVRDWHLSHAYDPIVSTSGVYYMQLLSEAQVHDNLVIQQRDRVVLRVPPLEGGAAAEATHEARGVRLEISISATLAEAFGFVPFGRVLVRSVPADEVEMNFVELVFRKQFLQRGNMWRFKKSMVGRTAFAGQTVNVDGLQATVQELACKGVAARSGMVLESTQMIFRSRSTRIIWLVQISAEMWEYDHMGDLYYEKFLNKFVGPLLDRWQALSTSHSLSVVFFARTLYADKDIAAAHASNGAGTGWLGEDMQAQGSHLHRRPSDGMHYQDFFKVVIENVAELIKTNVIKTLKQEFWAFPKLLKWQLGKAAPSDAASGNVLEAINTTLNVLDKHHMDRDLLRTGNSIVMVSASPAFYKVNPWMAQISKQRMMDNGIGLDFVSLSQPPLHVVPLFLVDCSTMMDARGAAYASYNEGVQAAQAISASDGGSSGGATKGSTARSKGQDKDEKTPNDVVLPFVQDFYEIPHWMSVSYVDCKHQNSFFFLPPTKTQQLAAKDGSSGHTIGSGNSLLSSTASQGERGGQGYNSTARKFDAIRENANGEEDFEPKRTADVSNSLSVGGKGSKAFDAKKNVDAGSTNTAVQGAVGAASEGRASTGSTAKTNDAFLQGKGNDSAKKQRKVSSSSAVSAVEDFAAPPFTSQINGYLEMNKMKISGGVRRIFSSVKHAPQSASKVMMYTAVLVDTGLPSVLRTLLENFEKKRHDAKVQAASKAHGSVITSVDTASLLPLESAKSSANVSPATGDMTHNIRKETPWGSLKFNTCKADLKRMIATIADSAASITASTLAQQSRKTGSVLLGTADAVFANSNTDSLPAMTGLTAAEPAMEIFMSTAEKAAATVTSPAAELEGGATPQGICTLIVNSIIESACATSATGEAIVSRAYTGADASVEAVSQSVDNSKTVELARLEVQNEQQQQKLRIQREVLERQQTQILQMNLEVEYRAKVHTALKMLLYRRRFRDIYPRAAKDTQELPYLPRTSLPTTSAHRSRSRSTTRPAFPSGSNPNLLPADSRKREIRSRANSTELSFSFEVGGNSSFDNRVSAMRTPTADKGEICEQHGGSYGSVHSLNSFSQDVHAATTNKGNGVAGSFTAPLGSFQEAAELARIEQERGVMSSDSNNLFFLLSQSRYGDMARVESYGSLSASANISGITTGSFGSAGRVTQTNSNAGSFIYGSTGNGNSIDYHETPQRITRPPPHLLRNSKGKQPQLQVMVEMYDDNVFTTSLRSQSGGTSGTAPRTTFAVPEGKAKSKTSSGRGEMKQHDKFTPANPSKRHRSNSLTNLSGASEQKFSETEERDKARQRVSSIGADAVGSAVGLLSRSKEKSPLQEEHKRFQAGSFQPTKTINMSGSYDGAREAAMAAMTALNASGTTAVSQSLTPPEGIRDAVHEMVENDDAVLRTSQGISRILNLIVAYRARYAINPFRRGEGDAFLLARIHNRRRWSHVFPKLWRETQRNLNNANSQIATNDGYSYYGLNWKSLCQPAILPITTDYVPKVTDLVNAYNIQTNYDLILDPRECPFATPQALLIEMVCQRLSQEYQLVEGDGFDPAPYLHYVLSTEGKSVNKQSLSEKLSTAASDKKIEVGDNGVLFYVLSMGHRVQFLMYDPSNMLVKVVQLVSNKVEADGQDEQRNHPIHSFHLGRNTSVPISASGTSTELEMTDIVAHDTADAGVNAAAMATSIINSATSTTQFGLSVDSNKLTKYSTALYDYSIWVPQTHRFQVLTQQFWQFPSDFFWNKVDGILIGTGRFDIQGSDGHRYGDEIRAKRLRFAVLPDIVTTDREIGDYLAKIEKLLQFFRDKLFKGERIDVKFDKSLKPSDLEEDEGQSSQSHSVSSVPTTTTIGTAVIPARAPRQVIARKDYTVPIWLRPPISGEYASASGYGDTKDIPKDYKPSTFSPEWAFLKHDASVSAHRVFLIELHWLVCDSWIMDKLVNLLFRRCSTWQLKLAQIPEFFISANLQLHPFRAQPYLAVPPTTSMPPPVRHKYLLGNSWAYFSEKPCYPTAVELVERLFLKVRGKAWIEDEARRTNWGELGLPTPDYQSANTTMARQQALTSTSLTVVAAPAPVLQPVVEALPEIVPEKKKSEDGVGLGTLLSAPLTFLANQLSSGDSSSTVDKNTQPVNTPPVTPPSPQATARKITPIRPSDRGIVPQQRRYTPIHNQITPVRQGAGGMMPLSRGASFHGGTSPGDLSYGNRQLNSGGNSTVTSNNGNSSTSNTSSSNQSGKSSTASAAIFRAEMLRKRLQPNSSQTNLDRQYMHRQGVACVRVAAHGFVWLLNSGVRVASIGGKTERDRAEKDKEAYARPEPKALPPAPVVAPPIPAEAKQSTKVEPRDKGDKEGKDIDGKEGAEGKEEVAKQAITAKDGTIINIKERRSNNPASTLAALAAAAEGAEKDKAQALEDAAREASSASAEPHKPSGLTAAMSKIEKDSAAVTAFVSRVEDTFERAVTKQEEDYDAQTPDGRRELALRALKQLESFCVAVGNSYDILVSIIESAMTEAEEQADARRLSQAQQQEQMLLGEATDAERLLFAGEDASSAAVSHTARSVGGGDGEQEEQEVGEDDDHSQSVSLNSKGSSQGNADGLSVELSTGGIRESEGDIGDIHLSDGKKNSSGDTSALNQSLINSRTASQEDRDDTFTAGFMSGKFNSTDAQSASMEGGGSSGSSASSTTSKSIPMEIPSKTE